MIDLNVDRCCRTCAKWAANTTKSSRPSLGICREDGEQTEATTYCYAWTPIVPATAADEATLAATWGGAVHGD